MLRIKLNGKYLDLVLKNGRYQTTFIPTHPDDVLEFVHEDVIEPFKHTLDYTLTQMQLEHGEAPTDYGHNMSTKSMLGFLLEDLDYIELAMKDPKSRAHGRFQLNHEAVLTEFINGDGTLKTQSTTIAGKLLNEITSKSSALIQEMTPEIFKTTIRSADFSSVSQQTKKSLFSAIFDDAGNIINAINQTPKGTTIRSDLITLSGDTYMTNAFARNLVVDQLKTNDITAFMGKYASVVASNIDVNNLTGNKANFLQVLLDGNNSKMRLVGDQLNIVRNDGSYSSRFTDNGLEIWRDGVKIGSVISLDAIDTYGYYNNRRSISLTTEPDSYISLSYYSEYNNRYYRALGLGGDGRLRIHAPLYDGVTNNGFRLAYGSISGTDAMFWRDIYSDGGMAVMKSREVFLSLSNGYWISIDRIKNDIEDLKRAIDSLKKSVNSNVYTPPSNTGGTVTPKPSTPSPTPSTPKPPTHTTGTTIGVGDRVKIRSGVTTYYDSNGRSKTIPTSENWNGVIWNPRTETYTVGNQTDAWGTTRYRLDRQGVVIAWAPASSLTKV